MIFAVISRNVGKNTSKHKHPFHEASIFIKYKNNTQNIVTTDKKSKIREAGYV